MLKWFLLMCVTKCRLQNVDYKMWVIGQNVDYKM